MKQWLILSLVVLLFILVWGTVVYQVIFKEEQKTRYANNLSQVHLIENQRVITEEVEPVIEEVPLKEFTRNYTELNKSIEAPIKQGIDFGEGISIDDLLNNFGIIVNN